MEKEPEDQRRIYDVLSLWPFIREMVMFTVGMAVFVVETTHPGEPRHYVLLACGFLIGLPVASYIDRWFGKNSP